MQPRIGLVMSEHPDYLSAETHAGYAAFKETLEALTGGTCETTHYLDDLPVRATVLVLTGSYAPWSVHDRHELQAYTTRLSTDSRPILGVCAGSQLLARAAGGHHDRMPDPSGEQGFLEVTMTRPHPALEGLPETWHVFQQHADEVTSLPPSLGLVASSPRARVQAFIASDRPWWGTQFHPERYDEAHPVGRELLLRFFAATA
jgi:GMP synthase-like glutamine amidotransferase